MTAEPRRMLQHGRRPLGLPVARQCPDKLLVPEVGRNTYPENEPSVPEFAGQGTSEADDAIALVQQKDPTLGSRTKAQVRTRRRRPALSPVLLLDELEQRLRHPVALEDEEHPPDRVLSPRWELVGLDSEDLAARVVAEQQQVRQRRNRVVAMYHDTGRSRAPLKQRVQLPVFGDGVVSPASPRASIRLTSSRLMNR